MEDLKTKINNMFKEAMKNKDTVRINVLKLLKASITNEEVKNKVSELSDEQVIEVINREIKRRREAIEEFNKVGKPERAKEEEIELKILLEFLPPQLTEEEINNIIDEAIKSTGAVSLKDMGKVMGQVMKQVRGRADGRIINELVRKKLGG